MVATAVALLVQVPPDGVADKVLVPAEEQIVVVPVIALGFAFTVIEEFTAAHPGVV